MSKPIDDLEELMKKAEAAGVQHLEHFRKTDLVKILNAMENKDQAAIDATYETVLGRLKKKEVPAAAEPPAVTDLAAKVLAQTAQNAGIAPSFKPAADLIGKNFTEEDRAAAQAQAAEILQRSEVKEQPFFEPGLSSEQILERMRSGPVKKAIAGLNGPGPSRGPMEDAIRMARQGSAESAEAEEPAEAERFMLEEPFVYYGQSGAHKLPSGSVVSRLTHDMTAFQPQQGRPGAKLRKVEGELTAVHSETGRAIGMVERG